MVESFCSHRAGIGRRQFVLGSVAALMTGRTSRADGAGGRGPRHLRIGVLSDIHIERRGLEDERCVYGSDTTFRRTLSYFRQRKVDVVICAGDMANRGRFSELKLVADDWNAVFPGNRDPFDGRQVEPFFIYGNHDVDSWSYLNEGVSDLVCRDVAGAWKRAFGEDYAPIQTKVVRGYVFVGAHWGNEDGMKNWLADNAKRLSLTGDRPFFYVQHPYLRDTNDPENTATDDRGFVTKALSDYPNAVAFAGHCHRSLADDRQFWQGAFSSIGCSSLSYLWLPDALGGHGRSRKQSSMVWDSDLAREAMIVDVFDSCLNIERIDMLEPESLADDVVVRIPARGEDSPLAFKNQMALTKPPEFPAGAVLEEWREQGNDRQSAIQNQVVLKFPIAESRLGNSRAIRYLVQVFADGQDGPVFRDYMLHPHFFRNPRRFDRNVVIRIPASSLPDGVRLSYAVAPEDCWGRLGRALSV